jgi:hypothetical protein
MSFDLCILLVILKFCFLNCSGNNNNNKMLTRDFWVKIYKSLDVSAVDNCICANVPM